MLRQSSLLEDAALPQRQNQRSGGPQRHQSRRRDLAQQGGAWYRKSSGRASPKPRENSYNQQAASAPPDPTPRGEDHRGTWRVVNYFGPEATEQEAQTILKQKAKGEIRTLLGTGPGRSVARGMPSLRSGKLRQGSLNEEKMRATTSGPCWMGR